MLRDGRASVVTELEGRAAIKQRSKNFLPRPFRYIYIKEGVHALTLPVVIVLVIVGDHLGVTRLLRQIWSTMYIEPNVFV